MQEFSIAQKGGSRGAKWTAGIYRRVMGLRVGNDKVISDPQIAVSHTLHYNRISTLACVHGVGSFGVRSLQKWDVGPINGANNPIDVRDVSKARP